MQVMTENKFVPKLRFKEFKEHWKENKLGNIATFYNSKRVALTASDREKGEYPYYGASGIIDYVKDFIFEGEYILLGEDGANIVMRNSRLVFLAKGKFWLNNHAHIFQSKDSNAFLCEALERINYTKYNTGTAQPKLNSEVVKKLKLNLPSSAEQQKIASFLSAVDEKLQQLKKKKELLEEYKIGVMQKIFSKELRFKDEFGNNYPNWEKKRLNEVFHSKKGSGLSGKNIVSDGKKKCILYGALYTKYDEVIDEVIESTNEDGKVKSQIGDILVPASTTTTGIDLANFTALNQEEILLGGDITILRFINKGSNIYWAHYLTHYKKYKVAAFAQGSTIVHIYFSHFGKIQIEEPSLKEQQKIANFLSSIDKKIDLVSTQIENTKTFKKGLLQQMFV